MSNQKEIDGLTNNLINCIKSNKKPSTEIFDKFFNIALFLQIKKYNFQIEKNKTLDKLEKAVFLGSNAESMLQYLNEHNAIDRPEHKKFYAQYEKIIDIGNVANVIKYINPEFVPKLKSFLALPLTKRKEILDKNPKLIAFFEKLVGLGNDYKALAVKPSRNKYTKENLEIAKEVNLKVKEINQHIKNKGIIPKRPVTRRSVAK